MLFICFFLCYTALEQGVVSMAMLSSLAVPEGFISTTYGTARDQGAVEVTTLSFHRVSKDNSDSVAMRAGRVTMRSAQSHRDFCVSRRPYCYFFAWYCHFMLCLLILCHLCRVNNREAGNLRRHHSHYDVTVMWSQKTICHLSVDAIVIRLISWYMHRRSEWRKVVFSGTSMGSILHLWWG